MREFASRLLAATDGCRQDMHEPDEQDLKARIVGNYLDNAFGEQIRTEAVINGYQEYVVILDRFDQNAKFQGQCFNLATLIALARIGAQRVLAE